MKELKVTKIMWTNNVSRRKVDELTQRIRALTGPGSAVADGSGAAEQGGAPAEPSEAAAPKKEPLLLFETAFKRWSAAKRTAGSDTGDAAPHPSESVIPKFHFGPPPARDDSFSRAVAQEHFSRHADAAVGNTELKSLWTCLKKHGEPNDDPSAAVFINYEQLLQCDIAMQKECPKFRPFFRPCMLMCLWRNKRGLIPINQLIDLVMRQVSVWHSRLELCHYVQPGKAGSLNEDDLENYIFDRIASMAQLNTLGEHFYDTYVVYASRRFFFFLDRNRTGKLKIQTLLQSDIMGEFNELHEEYLEEDYEQSNWFSVPYVSRVHGMYIELDDDNNGLLSRTEIQSYDGGGLTAQFVDRLFQEYTTYNGEIDYKLYLDFVLAKENPKHKQSIQFFFRLLDMDRNGELTPLTISYFWRGIMDHPLAADIEPIEPDDIVHEIFDMVRPASRTVITLKDLLNSGQGDVVCRILSDVNGFIRYEQREQSQSEVKSEGSGRSR